MLSKNKELSISFGVLVFALALIVYIIPTTVISPRSVPHAVLAPSFWPNVIAWMLLLLGIGMTVKSFLFLQEVATAAVNRKLAVKKLLRLSAIAAFLAIFYLLLPKLGMIWGSCLAYLVFSLLICKTRHLVAAASVGLLLPIALYAFFYHVAGVDIPQSDFVRLP